MTADCAAGASIYAVVAGGVNMDIGGQSFGPLVAADSNPGRVRVSPGGVGRNIAHNLCLLGVDVRLLTAFGDDLYGDRIAQSCGQHGIDVSHALRLPGAATSTYLYLTDPAGEMALAVSDMELCSRITPQYLERELPLLQSVRVVVADANLPAESLAFLAETCTAPLFCDPVSTAKAARLRPLLGKIHTLKPNRLEAEVLSGVAIHGPEDAARAADVLLKAGVRQVFLSLGADGVYAADGCHALLLPNLPGRLVNTTGCGDAFMAALVWAWLEDLDLVHTAMAGLAAGSIAMESAETIHPGLSPEALLARMDQVE